MPETMTTIMMMKTGEDDNDGDADEENRQKKDR